MEATRVSSFAVQQSSQLYTEKNQEEKWYLWISEEREDFAEICTEKIDNATMFINRLLSPLE